MFWQLEFLLSQNTNIVKNEHIVSITRNALKPGPEHDNKISIGNLKIQ